MAQQVFLVNVNIPTNDTLIDAASCDFVIEQTGTDTSLTPSTVLAKISGFYTSVLSGMVHAPGEYMHPALTRATNGVIVKMYDITAHLNGTPHGSPVFTSSFTLPAAVSTSKSVPEGLACMIGYQSAYGSDVEFAPGARPRSRDRGRFYFGPLNSFSWNPSLTTRVLWLAGFITDMTKAVAGLWATTGTSDIPTWVQWSRSNASVKQITHAWMDDGPRYQRRRVDLGSEISCF